MSQDLEINEQMNLIVLGQPCSGKTTLIKDLKGVQEISYQQGLIQYDYLNLTYMNKNLIVGIYELDLEDIKIFFKIKQNNVEDFRNSIFLLLIPQLKSQLDFDQLKDQIQFLNKSLDELWSSFDNNQQQIFKDNFEKQYNIDSQVLQHCFNVCLVMNNSMYIKKIKLYVQFKSFKINSFSFINVYFKSLFNVNQQQNSQKLQKLNLLLDL